MKKKSVVILLSGLFLAGCQSMMDKYDGPDEFGNGTSRDTRSPESWIGANKDELMAALGAPPRAVHSRGPQGQPTYSYVYGEGDGSKDCIATYLIEKSSGRVLQYNCY